MIVIYNEKYFEINIDKLHKEGQKILYQTSI